MMKAGIICLGMATILIVGLAGCEPWGVDAGDAFNTPGSGTPEVTIPAIIGASPTADGPRVSESVTVEIAPSYEEIQTTIFHLTKRDVDPAGPAVNDDGIVDPEIAEGLYDYQDFLRSKRVEGWVGWYVGYTSMKSGQYNLSISMMEPGGDLSTATDVLLREVSREQWQSLELSDNSQDTSYPRVVYSGTIQGILHSGQILMNNIVLILER
jgi:hypothetical protein